MHLQRRDVDGDPVSFTVTSAPTKGTLDFNPATGTYLYTPTEAARRATA